MNIITSRRQAAEITLGGEDGTGPERRYTIAPLTLFERNMFTAEMNAAGFPMMGPSRMREALRDALRDLAPANLEELLAVLDEFDALQAAGEPIPPDMAREREVIVLAALKVPHYAAVYAAEQAYWSMMPFFILRRALRGWQGDGLPPFAAKRGQVDQRLIEQLPEADLPRLGNEAWVMAFLPATAGNASGALSPANDSQAVSAAE
jgi:hypothetical protein